MIAYGEHHFPGIEAQQYHLLIQPSCLNVEKPASDFDKYSNRLALRVVHATLNNTQAAHVFSIALRKFFIEKQMYENFSLSQISFVRSNQLKY